MRLGIILPSNNPSAFMNNFLPTVQHIKELADFSSILINFQPPWRRDEIIIAHMELSGYGFEVRSDYNEYSRPVPMGKVRQSAAKLGEDDCDIFLSVDDDFKFSPGTKTQKKTSGKKYLDCLDYMAKNERCGVVFVKGFFGGAGWGEKISPIWGDMYATYRGLFLRKVPGMLFTTPAACAIRGGLEESIAVFGRIARGYWPAKQMNNPTMSFTERVDRVGLPEHDIHNPEVIAGAVEFIRMKYEDPDWTYDKRTIPKGADRRYTAWTDENGRAKMFTIDYSQTSTGLPT